MKKLGVMSAALFLLTVVVSVGAQLTYPEELNEIVKQYPSSEVKATMRIPEGVQVILLTKDPTDKVYKYYKESVEGKGWRSSVEVKTEDGISGNWTKGGNTVAVNISHDDEGTEIAIVTQLK